MSTSKSPIKVLFVHLYFFGLLGEDFALFNKLVSKKLLQIAKSFDLIVILTGSIAGRARIKNVREFRHQLIKLGIPASKVVTKHTYGLNGPEPLDTWQEVASAQKILYCLRKIYPNHHLDLYALVLDWHGHRTGLIYSNYGIKCQIERVKGPKTPQRLIFEFCGFVLALVDRKGESFILKREREKRKKMISH